MGDAASILSISPSLIRWLDDYEIDDLVEYFGPDAVFVADEPDADLDYRDVYNRFDAVAFYPGEEGKQIRHVPINGIDFVVIDGVNALDVARELEDTGRFGDAEHVYLITTDIDIKLDTTDLSASLVNEQEYREFTSQTDTQYVLITGSLPSHYHEEWGDMVVQGGRPKESQGGLLIPRLTCYVDGRVAVDTLRSSQLGLRALEGVGRKTKEKLVDNGFETREDIATATRSEMKEIYGIGEKTANRLWYHSRALEGDEVKRRANTPVPGDAPVFIDIEADGVTPSVIWHIGAYNSATDTYESFLATTPEEKGDVVKSFMSWYAADCEGQTLVSWKGWEYDYIHLAQFIADHAPEYAAVWDSSNKRDLYYWAVERDNAVLPGRTDEITEIAAALGYEVNETQLTADQVQRKYREWMSGEADAPDWKRMRRYCQNNIEALVRIYDEISLKENVHGGANTSN